ncbi:MAG TPA: glycine-rich protein, partial [Thermomicrobiaceae bacterium]|nr:glycine-rich protein [Thermomicrobiaceae bacterium]
MKFLARTRGLSSFGTLIIAMVLTLAPLLALTPIGPAQAASGDCTYNSGQVTCTYTYTGAAQTWAAPADVTSATFDVYGAAGGSAFLGENLGGLGGEATATLTNLTTNESITLMVGGAGGTIAGNCTVSQPGSGGFNGGGSGGGNTCPSAGGGGASDVRIGGTDLSDRVLVAGGGGGASNSYECTSSCVYGGSGGGLTGGSGFTIGGSAAAGGGQTSGSGSGQLGQGGTGADGTNSGGITPAGGGGGGGYYGGAGGPQWGGGGGGSGYGPSGVVFHSGVHSGNGQIIITYSSPDTTPPTTTASYSNGYTPGSWTNQSVTVTLSAVDNSGGSGVAATYYAIDNSSCAATTDGIASCTTYSQPFTISSDGNHTLTYFSVDNAGNIEAANTASIMIDTVAPTASPTLSGQQGSNGWYTGTVTVTWNWTDNQGGSGINTSDCAATTTYSGPDSATASQGGTCQDNAGNIGTASQSFMYDAIPPTITATVSPTNPAGTGWYNQATGAPTVSFTCGDAVSGIPAGACPASYTFPEGTNQSDTGTVTNNAGVSNSATMSGINVDLTPPTVTYSGNNGTYTINQQVAVTCTAADPLSNGSAS